MLDKIRVSMDIHFEIKTDFSIFLKTTVFNYIHFPMIFKILN